MIIIIDELYNIGLFSFKYTYNYNYGTFNSKFNNIQTIECETNRFKVYNKTNFLFKDIFNKSYLNYLIKIAITFITVLFIISYGIYFYDIFIDKMPYYCSFDEVISTPKEILKCLCNDCHKLIPNCTDNYLIAFVLLLLIPLAYLCKSFLWFDFTPSSSSSTLYLVYILIFIMLIFKYPYDILIKLKSETKYTDLFVYLLVTIVFIISGYLYKYIYNKYNNNITLNSVNDVTVFNDMYRQTPPIKPLPINKPDIIDNFKYDVKNTDPAYKLNKEIADRYYRDLKNYETELNYYNQRYENFNNSLNSNLKEKITFFDVLLNITGLNNYLHLLIILFIVIIAAVYYYFEKNHQILLICMVYLISILAILTIFNAVQYYNTYINKYIIYEPTANYKSDLTVVNTKLNLILDTSNGENFYNILTNNKKGSSTNISDNDIIITRPVINSQIRNLNADNIFTNLAIIDSNIRQIPFISNNGNIVITDDYTVYFNSTGVTTTNLFKYFYTNVTSFIRIANYKYPINCLYFHYSNNLKLRVETDYHIYSNLYIYYKSYQLYKFIDRLEVLLYTDIKKLKTKYYNLFREIYTNYSNIKSQKTTIITDIDANISSIKGAVKIPYDIIAKNFDEFIKNELNKITISNAYNLKKILEPLPDSADNIFGTDSIIIKSDITADTIIMYLSPNPPNIATVDTTYIELPNKITDDKNNEYYLISNSNISYSKIRIKFFKDFSTDLKIMLKYDISSSLTSTTSTFTNNSGYFTGNIADTSIINYPFKILTTASDDYTDTFIKIIMRCIIYNLTAIANNFDNQDLCKKIYSGGTNECTTSKKTKVFTAYTSTNFNTFNLDNPISSYNDFKTKKFIKDINTNYYGYLVLLYNIYNYNEDTLLDIIEYIIYTKSTDTISNFNDSNSYYLNINLNKIKTQINRNVINTPLISIYKNNIYIVRFILKLYTLFINKIKYNIETKVDKTAASSLCTPSTLTKEAKEQAIYNYIDSNFTITLSDATNNTATKRSVSVSINDTEINNISDNCTYFFNICLYLLKYNVNNAADLSMQSMTDSIISNYKFYNTEEDNIDLSSLRKELTIACNYYNKYNNINTKQILIMKNNTDAVAYNFPVLLVILLIFLGESVFIKS